MADNVIEGIIVAAIGWIGAWAIRRRSRRMDLETAKSGIGRLIEVERTVGKGQGSPVIGGSESDHQAHARRLKELEAQRDHLAEQLKPRRRRSRWWHRRPANGKLSSRTRAFGRRVSRGPRRAMNSSALTSYFPLRTPIS
jgi:hypothetical protein